MKILFVDDEEHILIVIGERIKSWGHELITAPGGKEALALLEKEKPDAIILDYMMPRMNGIETLRKIRQTDQKIPVIMFTAHPDGKSIGGAEKLGVSACIPKMGIFSDTTNTLKSTLEMIKKTLKKG